jgi:hypothetical protein
MNTKELRITEVEFDLIKQNLKNYLRSQSEFTSYNFEGSALNILLDILAYNTYYQAFYNNMTVNEMFLDSAIKRSSIVSIAKHFAYRPKTIKSARVLVELFGSPETMQDGFSKGTRILASNNGSSYSFILLDDVIASVSEYDQNGEATEFSTGTVEFVEGSLKKYTFLVDGDLEDQRYVIPYRNVDASTLRVTVQSSIASTQTVAYTEATNITLLRQDSNIYFLEENADGYLELIFGDGVLGRRLSDGNVIRIEIIESSGEEANGVGIANSTSNFSIPTASGVSIRTVVPSNGGSQEESKESIRFNTTRNFVTQERAVTKEDYRNIILKDFPIIEDVICWGGEDNDPPAYGRVFVSVKPKTGAILSSGEKANIISTLSSTRNVVGVLVEFVDPEILYLNLTVNLKVDPIDLPTGMSDLVAEVTREIYDFTDETLNKFDKDFYATDLSTKIQSINDNIISNDIGVSLEKRFVPIFDAKPHNYEIRFNNQLYHPQDGYKSVLTSNVFGYVDTTANEAVDRDCLLEDDGYGNVVLYYVLDNEKIVINAKIGTIDYSTGKVTLTKFKPSSLVDGFPIVLFAVPYERDIVAKQKMFLYHEYPSSRSLTINTTQIPYRNR